MKLMITNVHIDIIMLYIFHMKDRIFRMWLTEKFKYHNVNDYEDKAVVHNGCLVE